MAQGISSKQKKALTDNLTKSLPVLRARLGINQAELAEKIGMTQQTLTAIESGKREMTWVTFVALTLLFMQNEDTRALLPVVDVYTSDLEKFFSFSGENAEEGD